LLLWVYRPIYCRSLASWETGGIETDTDPFSGETLAEIVMANQSDLDEAYQAAAKAQPFSPISCTFAKANDFPPVLSLTI
jgi:acyl-CoA reductase-like NAD-dependent aldehyde dehydrogenase